MRDLDKNDIKILDLLQKNCKVSAKEIATSIGSPITTVFAKIKRMEKLGLIKGYKAILDGSKLQRSVTALIMISFAYRQMGTNKILSQRELANKLTFFQEVQDVFIIAGEYDLAIKVKVRDVEEIGKFIIDRLRKLEGIDKTLTFIALDAAKESSDISLTQLTEIK